MSHTINGTCSLCGGAVTTPTFWWGVVPPTPSCSQCGAVPAQAHGPVIPMQPAPRYHATNGTSVQDIQEVIDRHNADQAKRCPASDAVKEARAIARRCINQHMYITATAQHDYAINCAVLGPEDLANLHRATVRPLS